MNELHELLVEIAQEAGQLALTYQLRPADLKTATKGALDFVTAADKAIEKTIVSAIHARFPDDAILAEEGGRQGGDTGRLWVIDPIDGTSNYMRGFPWWSVSIGVLKDGKPHAGIVHSPAMGVTLATVVGEGVTRNGERFEFPTEVPVLAPVVLVGCSQALRASGIEPSASAFIRDDLIGLERRLGSGTASLLQVLTGHAELYLGFGENLWDVCASAIIAEELGLSHSLNWEDVTSAMPFNFFCGKPLWLKKTNQHAQFST
ncbi:inositol monophosphatase [Rhizobium ruizarguesonis]